MPEFLRSHFRILGNLSGNTTSPPVHQSHMECKDPSFSEENSKLIVQLSARMTRHDMSKSPTPNMSQEPQTNAYPFVPPSPRFQPGGLGADSKDAKALVKGCERVSSRKSSSPGRKDSPSSAKRRRKTSKKMRSLVKHHKRRKSNASKQELQSHLDLACASQINLTTQ